jgi:ketosteroid isomerase-like protein
MRTTRDLIDATTDTWNARDRAGYLALYDEDCELTVPGFAGRGREAVGLFWDLNMNAFPDNRVSVLRVVGGDGDAPAAEESVIEGTHTGPLLGADGSELPPTGRHMSGPFCALHEQRGGLLVSSHVYYDQLELLTQLGVPTGESALSGG